MGLTIKFSNVSVIDVNCFGRKSSGLKCLSLIEKRKLTSDRQGITPIASLFAVKLISSYCLSSFQDE